MSPWNNPYCDQGHHVHLGGPSPTTVGNIFSPYYGLANFGKYVHKCHTQHTKV